MGGVRKADAVTSHGLKATVQPDTNLKSNFVFRHGSSASPQSKLALVAFDVLSDTHLSFLEAATVQFQWPVFPAVQLTIIFDL